MKKISFALVACICLSASILYAQTYKIGVNQFVEHPALDAVTKGLQDYFVDQKVEVKWNIHNAQANPGTAAQIAKQMLGEKNDLLVAVATPSAQACAQLVQKAPSSFKRPLLFTAITDPVTAGLVKDLEKPGGMITGVSDLLPIKEHIKMLFTFKPDIKRLGFLYNAGELNSRFTLKSVKELGETMGFEVIGATAAKTADVYQAAKSLVGRVDAIFIPTDNTIVSALESAIKIGVEHKLPVFAADVDSVARGAVAAMGFDYYKHGYQTGAMAMRILRGEKPGDIPVEFQKDLQLYINATYAQKMGLTPPEKLLEQAEKVYK